MKKRLRDYISRLTSAMLQPAACITIMGYLISLGAFLRLGFMPDIVRNIGTFITSVFLEVIRYHLPVIFCTGVACSLNRNRKNLAAFDIVIV